MAPRFKGCRSATASVAGSQLAAENAGTARRGSHVDARRGSCTDGKFHPPFSLLYMSNILSSPSNSLTLFFPSRISKDHGLHGAQAQFIRVPLATSSLLKLPPSVSDDEALLLGDIFSTGYFCAENGFSALQNQASEEAVAVVVGCGPVGIMAVVGVIDLGCKTVYAVDSIPERLELARKFGAIPVHLTEGKPVEVIKKATNGRGADVVLEVRTLPIEDSLVITSFLYFKPFTL